MHKNSKTMKQLREALKDSFPNRTANELNMMFNSLKNNDFYDRQLHLYIPTFRGIVLRVGLITDDGKCCYFSTDAELELEELLG